MNLLIQLRKARRTHARSRVDARTEPPPHYIHNEYSYPTPRASLTLYKYILSLSRGS